MRDGSVHFQVSSWTRLAPLWLRHRPGPRDKEKVTDSELSASKFKIFLHVKPKTLRP